MIDCHQFNTPGLLLNDWPSLFLHSVVCVTINLPCVFRISHIAFKTWVPLFVLSAAVFAFLLYSGNYPLIPSPSGAMASLLPVKEFITDLGGGGGGPEGYLSWGVDWEGGGMGVR